MIRNLVAGGLVAALVATAPAQAAVNLIQNGSFEEPILGNISNSRVPVLLPEWSNTIHTLIRPESTILPVDGSQYFVSVRNVLPLSQQFTTTPGAKYILSFSFLTLAENASSANVTNSDLSVLLPNTGLGWSNYSKEFTAFGTSSELQFTFTGLSVVRLDAISVTAVAAAIPEAATWAMMLIGFAGLGYAARRRREAAAA